MKIEGGRERYGETKRESKIKKDIVRELER